MANMITKESAIAAITAKIKDAAISEEDNSGVSLYDSGWLEGLADAMDLISELPSIKKILFPDGYGPIKEIILPNAVTIEYLEQRRKRNEGTDSDG